MYQKRRKKGKKNNTSNGKICNQVHWVVHVGRGDDRGDLIVIEIEVDSGGSPQDAVGVIAVLSAWGDISPCTASEGFVFADCAIMELIRTSTKTLENICSSEVRDRSRQRKSTRTNFRRPNVVFIYHPESRPHSMA